MVIANDIYANLEREPGLVIKVKQLIVYKLIYLKYKE
jgi:hypothetical protein